MFSVPPEYQEALGGSPSITVLGLLNQVKQEAISPQNLEGFLLALRDILLTEDNP
jgi:hypothetical protein